MRNAEPHGTSSGLPIIGASAQATALRDVVARLAAAGVTGLLVGGEAGAGRWHLARAIHAASRRAPLPCLQYPCAEAHVPSTALLGAPELSERGGLAGAVQGGTLVLRDVERLPEEIQAALLAWVEAQPAPGRPLVVGITAEEAPAGPLVAWLAATPVLVPPLRERAADVLPLAHHFLGHATRRLGRSLAGFSDAAERHLLDSPWPGNARELREVVERAARIASGSLVDAEALARVAPRPAWLVTGRPRPLRDIEDAYIEHVLALTRGNKTRAARVLDIARETLRLRMLARRDQAAGASQG